MYEDQTQNLTQKFTNISYTIHPFPATSFVAMCRV